MDFLDSDLLNMKAEHWAAELVDNNHGPIQLDAAALVVVDMQKDFLLPEGLLRVWGGPAIISNVSKLISAFHAASMPVFFTRHIYENPETDGGLTARWWNVDRDSLLLREGTWHAELHEALTPGPGDRIITKRRYSAFFGTDLELLLRTSGVQKIVIAGVCTNICCEATAHDAFFRDFNIYFLLDGTGATDEEAHISTLRNIALCYGHVITVDQAIRGLNCSTAEPVKEFDRTGNQLIEDAARHTAATFNQ